MLARIVENWLTNAGELGYQTAYAQLLASEGYRILHAPVHHPFEHGKDMVAIAQDGSLHAFQLKGGDIGIKELETIQGQLFALAGTAVSYPGVEPPRLPDRVFLVTNGRLTAPARDRLRSFNEASRQRGFPIIEAVERDQLVGRFVDAHGTYLPTELQDLNELLQLVLASGSDLFPSRRFARMLWSLISPPGERRSAVETGRALASATILTAYATGPWHRAQNHLGVAEGWLTLAFAALRAAEDAQLAEEHWQLSFELARDSSRRELRLLLDEAAEAEDLIVPHVVEGLVYPARAALVCGYCAAFYLSERELADASDFSQNVQTLLQRESEYMQAPGEAAAPHLLLVATALEVLGDPVGAARIVLQWATALTVANHPESDSAVPDPYHSMNDVLLHGVGADSSLDDEQFAGEAYTLHIAIDWLARRGYRKLVDKVWPDVTRLHFVEFRPSTPLKLLAEDDPEGQQQTWAPDMPASWATLTQRASNVEEASLPMVLWQHLYMLPYLPLLLPYRLTSNVAKVVDYMTRKLCQVTFADAAEHGQASAADP